MANKQVWIFTFGCGQPNAGHFVKIEGTFDQARKKMFEKYGEQWALQYSEQAWQEWVDNCIKNGYDSFIETELKEN